MAKKTLAIVAKETPKQETQDEDRRIWRERAFTEEELFHGTGLGPTPVKKTPLPCMKRCCANSSWIR